MNADLKWKDVVRDALRQLGGEGHLSQINEIAESHPKSTTNPTWKDTIRRVVRQYKMFQPVPPERSGIYRLIEDIAPVVGTQTVTGNEQTKHGTVQGMLTCIGKLYGYETFVPRTDQTIRAFQGQPLSAHVSVKDCAIRFASRNIPKIRQIDVIWFDEDDDGLYPVYAFEVEETTGVKSGLDRLLKIPGRLNTGLYVIAPSDQEKSMFEGYCGQMPFRAFRTRFAFRLYQDVEVLYNTSVEHRLARDSFGIVERWRRPVSFGTEDK